MPPFRWRFCKKETRLSFDFFKEKETRSALLIQSSVKSKIFWPDFKMHSNSRVYSIEAGSVWLLTLLTAWIRVIVSKIALNPCRAYRPPVQLAMEHGAWREREWCNNCRGECGRNANFQRWHVGLLSKLNTNLEKRHLARRPRHSCLCLPCTGHGGEDRALQFQLRS